MSTVLILGASSDIGYAIARHFAAAKYDVQLAGRNIEPLRAFQSDLQIRYGISCSLHSFDALRFDSHSSFYSSLRSPDLIILFLSHQHVFYAVSSIIKI